MKKDLRVSRVVPGGFLRVVEMKEEEEKEERSLEKRRHGRCVREKRKEKKIEKWV